MKLGLLLALLLFAGQVLGASSQTKECEATVNWATEVFDLVTENPKVILSGMDPQDVNNFAFIRRWINEGRSRDELMAFIWSQCPNSV